MEVKEEALCSQRLPVGEARRAWKRDTAGHGVAGSASERPLLPPSLQPSLPSYPAPVMRGELRRGRWAGATAEVGVRGCPMCPEQTGWRAKIDHKKNRLRVPFCKQVNCSLKKFNCQFDHNNENIKKKSENAFNSKNIHTISNPGKCDLYARLPGVPLPIFISVLLGRLTCVTPQPLTTRPSPTRAAGCPKPGF